MGRKTCASPSGTEQRSPPNKQQTGTTLLCDSVVGACFSLSIQREGTRVNDNRFDPFSFRIFDGIFRSTRFTIEHSDHPCTPVNHPNISRLVAAPAMCLADGTHNICALKHSFVSQLPCLAHALFKAGMWYRAYQMDCRIGCPMPEDNFCCYDVHAPCDATDESAQAIVYGLADLALQCCSVCFFAAMELLGPMPGKAAPMFPFFCFSQDESPPSLKNAINTTQL